MSIKHLLPVVVVLVIVAGFASPAGADDLTPPAGTFTAVGSGTGFQTSGFFNCAIRTDRTLACWSANGATPPSPPAGEFTSLSVGSGHACAVMMRAAEPDHATR